MTTEEITKLYEEDSEVKKFIDSMGDKRVNQARETWNKRLPEEAEKIAVGILERKEREKDFRAEIENRLSGEGVPIEVGFKLMGEIGVDTPEEVLKSKLSEAVEQFNDIKSSAIKEKYGDLKQPVQSKMSSQEIKPLHDATSTEILQNLDKYQVRT